MPPPSFKDVLLKQAKPIKIFCTRCFATEKEHMCGVCGRAHCQWFCCGCGNKQTPTEKVYDQHQPRGYGGSGPRWYEIQCLYCQFVYSRSFD